MLPCMAPSPEDASTIALLCTLEADHDGHHIATSSRHVLAAWTRAGVVTLHYDHEHGTSRHMFAVH